MEDVQSKNDAHLKRLACSIFTQLPEGQADALRALRYVRLIVENLNENWESRSAAAAAGKITQLASASTDREAWQGGATEARPGARGISSLA